MNISSKGEVLGAEAGEPSDEMVWTYSSDVYGYLGGVSSVPFAGPLSIGVLMNPPPSLAIRQGTTQWTSWISARQSQSSMQEGPGTRNPERDDQVFFESAF